MPHSSPPDLTLKECNPSSHIANTKGNGVSGNGIHREDSGWSNGERDTSNLWETESLPPLRPEARSCPVLVNCENQSVYFFLPRTYCNRYFDTCQQGRVKRQALRAMKWLWIITLFIWLKTTKERAPLFTSERHGRKHCLSSLTKVWLSSIW